MILLGARIPVNSQSGEEFLSSTPLSLPDRQLVHEVGKRLALLVPEPSASTPGRDVNLQASFPSQSNGCVLLSSLLTFANGLKCLLMTNKLLLLGHRSPGWLVLYCPAASLKTEIFGFRCN